MNDWTARFKAWQAFADRINARASASVKNRHERAWAIAASVGIPRDGCCLHNAAIDTEMRGWCAGNPARSRVAKRANHMMNDWRESDLARRIVSRAYDRMMRESA